MQALEPRSFWQTSLPEIEKSDAVKLGAEHGIAIIGAGIVGLSTALHLRLLGFSESIDIVERGFVGYGGTGRSGGILVASNLYSAGSECDVEYLRFCLDALKLSSLIQSSDGRLLGTPGEYDNDVVNPMQLLAELHRKLNGLAVRIFEGVTQTAIREDRGQLCIATNSGTAVYKKCLLAVGAYSTSRASAHHGLAIRHEDCLVARTADSNIPWTFYKTISDNDYVWGRRVSQRRVLLGGGAKYSVPRGASKSDRVARLLTAMNNHLPEIRVTAVECVWTGLLSDFVDGNGWRLLKMNDRSSIFFVGGFGDYGLPAGFRAGLLAALVLLDRVSFDSRMPE